MDPRVKHFIDLLPSSRIQPPIPQTELLTTELSGAETAALRGEKPARQALLEANQRVNQAIAEGRVD